MNEEDKKRIEWGLKNKDKFLSDEHFRRYMMNEKPKTFSEELVQLYKSHSTCKGGK